VTVERNGRGVAQSTLRVLLKTSTLLKGLRNHGPLRARSRWVRRNGWHRRDNLISLSRLNLLGAVTGHHPPTISTWPHWTTEFVIVHSAATLTPATWALLLAHPTSVVMASASIPAVVERKPSDEQTKYESDGGSTATDRCKLASAQRARGFGGAPYRNRGGPATRRNCRLAKRSFWPIRDVRITKVDVFNYWFLRGWEFVICHENNCANQR
jgi:hypothetical protein